MWFAVLLYDIAYRVSGGKNLKFAMVLVVATVGYAFAWWLYERGAGAGTEAPGTGVLVGRRSIEMKKASH